MNDGGDTSKKARPEGTLENVGDLGWWRNLKSLGLGVELVLIRRKGHVTTRCGERSHILRERSRIAVEVLIGRKLEPIDEDACNNGIGMRPCLRHQVEMTLMQVAHGGHKGYAGPGRKCPAKIGDGVKGLHGQERIQIEGVPASSGHNLAQTGD